MSISPVRKLVSEPIPKPPTEEKEEEAPPSFHFKEITPEDWRANETPLADLYQRGIVSAEYVRERLKIPEEAGKGNMAPAHLQTPKPLSDVKSEMPERWRLKQSKRGVIAERIG
jgi:hypothetical protein